MTRKQSNSTEFIAAKTAAATTKNKIPSTTKTQQYLWYLIKLFPTIFRT